MKLVRNLIRRVRGEGQVVCIGEFSMLKTFMKTQQGYLGIDVRILLMRIL
jgi:hypothetical protein